MDRNREQKGMSEYPETQLQGSASGILHISEDTHGSKWCLTLRALLELSSRWFVLLFLTVQHADLACVSLGTSCFSVKLHTQTHTQHVYDHNI